MKTQSAQPVAEFTLPLTREQADAIYDWGREAVIFVLLELGARLAKKGGPSASTPSGMIPPYQKPAPKGRKKKPGAKPGHAGARRGPPPKVTHREEHPPLACCPECGSHLADPSECRFRLIEDIPETQPEVTEHGIPRQWCPGCKKLVEPPVVDAMPGARFGHRLVALTAWLHCGLVTDFWAAYSAVECAARQACLPHLFRELDKTDEADNSPAWAAFSKKLKRLLRDAVRLGRCDDLADERFASRRARLDRRLAGFVDRQFLLKPSGNSVDNPLGYSHPAPPAYPSPKRVYRHAEGAA